MKMDDRGRKLSAEESELANDASVLIVDPLNAAAALNRSATAEVAPLAEEAQPTEGKPAKEGKTRKKRRKPQ